MSIMNMSIMDMSIMNMSIMNISIMKVGNISGRRHFLLSQVEDRVKETCVIREESYWIGKLNEET
jgi:hypothetical protein